VSAKTPFGPDDRWVAVFSGGGTGGHLYPALALSGALGERRPDVRPFFVGAERGIEARVLPERGVEHLLLPVEGFRRGTVRANLPVLRSLGRALTAVASAFRTLRPRLVVVTGGYAGGPAGLVAVFMGIRLVLQEQNSVPGVTTRALSLMAHQVHVAFPEAAAYLPRPARRKVRVTGNPVQPPVEVDRAAAARRFGLDPERPVILVVGGSQGSRALNEAVLGAVTGGLAGGASPEQLLWSTGPTHLAGIRERLAGLGERAGVRAVGYIDTMPEALALATLAVSRAGAMATSEFLAWGIPSVLVPLPTAAADHQRRNAEALARAGAAEVIDEAELDGRVLRERIAGLLGDAGALARMATAARSRGRPHAAAEIAAALDALLPARRRTAGVTPGEEAP
jgi:UDP-N-acetylglucosamine--N-acetylmuramyl-(pentapeptide) pyrophosphoryl-undecaprenol N-acetylglucosamine transferase